MLFLFVLWTPQAGIQYHSLQVLFWITVSKILNYKQCVVFWREKTVAFIDAHEDLGHIYLLANMFNKSQRMMFFNIDVKFNTVLDLLNESYKKSIANFKDGLVFDLAFVLNRYKSFIYFLWTRFPFLVQLTYFQDSSLLIGKEILTADKVMKYIDTLDGT